MKRRKWFLLSLWILSLTAISRYGGAVSYGIFWSITFLPVISLIYLSLVYFNLRILQQLESRDMICGQPIPYFFVLQNDSFCIFASISVNLFSSFSFVEDLPGDTEYELLPGDKYAFETRLTCKYRGEYEVGVKEIVMTDFFRLFKLRYRIPGTIKALVSPKITRVTDLRSMDAFSNESSFRESLKERTRPDFMVRDYIPGDSPKQIHWKATAREQKLKLRTLTGEEKQGISLLWDTKRYDKAPKNYLPLEDKILETVLALGIFLAEKNTPFSAYFGQGQLSFTHVDGLGDFDGFYRQVSQTGFDQEEDFQKTLLEAMENGGIFGSRTVFCVLHQLNDQILTLADRLEKSGSLIILYLITDENADAYIRQSDERLKIIAIPVDAALEGRL